MSALPDPRIAFVPSAEERESFIICCWGEGTMSTYDIVKEVKFVFDIDVTEAEVCKLLKRHGEEREPSA